jgi:phage-related protein (TIGR01555 family)
MKVFDSFVNLLTNIGVVGRDKRMSATPVGPANFDYQTLENLYGGDDIVARLCDLPAKTMTRKWLQITGVDDPKEAADVLTAGRELGIQAKTREAITWGRLFGSALIIMGVDDGQTMDKPVNEKRIKSIDYLLVLDRWDLEIHSIVTEFGKNFGQPETYEVLSSATTTVVGIAGTEAIKSLQQQPIVHASRVLRFDAVPTPRRRKDQLQGWNESAVSRVYEVIRDFSQSYAGTAVALQNLGSMIYKLKDLGKMLAADKDSLVLTRLQLLETARSSVNMVPLDADGEELAPVASGSMTGAKDLLERWDVRLAGAIGWPVTVLMGRSPAGMNATGENDLAIFYDTMEGDQGDITPLLERFYRYLMLAKDGPTKGKELEGWALKWNKLWQESQGEQAKTRQALAQADAVYLDRGVLSPDEVANSRFAGDEYSIDTELDQEARETEAIEETDEPETVNMLRPEDVDPEIEAVMDAEGSKVQSIILSKKRFASAAEASAWVKSHDFHAEKIDETEESYRFRQQEPGRFQPESLRTIELTNGVKAVIGRPKA